MGWHPRRSLDTDHRPDIRQQLVRPFPSLELDSADLYAFSGTVFLKSLNVMDPFTATMIKRGVILVGCIFVILFVERIGRRRLCLIVGSMCAGSLIIMGGLGTVTQRQTDTSNGVLAMSILFPMFYMIGFGST